MSPGDGVLVFTASGTFRAHRGVVVRDRVHEVVVKLDGESSSMTFERRAVVPLNDAQPMIAGD